MAYFKGDTSLEVDAVLAHANLSDPASFETALSAVKTYVKAKMIKYQSNAVGLPGGKLEALERKYAHLGYQDLFYLTRLDLGFPPTTVHIPRPTSPIRHHLAAAGFAISEAEKPRRQSVTTSSAAQGVERRPSRSITGASGSTPQLTSRPRSRGRRGRNRTKKHIHSSSQSEHSPTIASSERMAVPASERLEPSRGAPALTTDAFSPFTPATHSAVLETPPSVPAQPVPQRSRALAIPRGSSSLGDDRDFFDVPPHADWARPQLHRTEPDMQWPHLTMPDDMTPMEITQQSPGHARDHAKSPAAGINDNRHASRSAVSFPPAQAARKMDRPNPIPRQRATGPTPVPPVVSTVRERASAVMAASTFAPPMFVGPRPSAPAIMAVSNTNAQPQQAPPLIRAAPSAPTVVQRSDFADINARPGVPPVHAHEARRWTAQREFEWANLDRGKAARRDAQRRHAASTAMREEQRQRRPKTGASPANASPIIHSSTSPTSVPGTGHLLNSMRRHDSEPCPLSSPALLPPRRVSEETGLLHPPLRVADPTRRRSMAGMDVLMGALAGLDVDSERRRNVTFAIPGELAETRGERGGSSSGRCRGLRGGSHTGSTNYHSDGGSARHSGFNGLLFAEPSANPFAGLVMGDDLGAGVMAMDYVIGPSLVLPHTFARKSHPTDLGVQVTSRLEDHIRRGLAHAARTPPKTPTGAGQTPPESSGRRRHRPRVSRRATTSPAVPPQHGAFDRGQSMDAAARRGLISMVFPRSNALGLAFDAAPMISDALAKSSPPLPTSARVPPLPRRASEVLPPITPECGTPVGAETPPLIFDLE